MIVEKYNKEKTIVNKYIVIFALHSQNLLQMFMCIWVRSKAYLEPQLQGSPADVPSNFVISVAQKDPVEDEWKEY